LKIINNVTDYIEENNNGKIHKVFTSPYKRCDETASLLMEKLNVNPKRKKQSNQLTRIQGIEDWNDVHIRGYKYGKHISSKYGDKNVIIVTHSSILLDVVKGTIKDRNLKKEYLHPCSLTIIKNGKLVKFNKGWKI